MGGFYVDNTEKKVNLQDNSEIGKSDYIKSTVQETPPRFPENTTWQDYPIDDDRNGLYNRLVIDIGWYYMREDFGVLGVLYDTTENILGITSYEAHNGETYVTLSFPGQPIYASGTDGPYSLKVGLYTPFYWKEIQLSEINFSMSYETLDHSYNCSQFERPRAMITGFSDFGYDTNLDTFYDEIYIEIQLEVTDRGYYEVLAYFEYPNIFQDREYDISSQWAGYLHPGNNTVEIQLLASEFYKTRVNEPIQMNYVFVSLYTEYQQIITDAYNTSTVFYSEISPLPAVLTGKYWDEGKDTDSTGLIDELDIIIEVNISYSGFYAMYLNLAPSISHDPILIYNQDIFIFWNEGITNISLTFDATPFHQIITLSSFVLQDLIIRNNDGIIIQYEARPYVTRNYSYSEFDYPRIATTGKYWDQGIDIDLNGFFDELVIIFEVNVTHTGVYGINLELQPSEASNEYWTQNIYQQWGFGSLGVQNVTFFFDTERYYSIRKNSSFEIVQQTILVNDELYLHTKFPYTTQEFHYTAFEKPGVSLTGNFGDYGKTGSSTTKYEQLAIICEVNAAHDSLTWFYIRVKALNSNVVWDEDQQVNLEIEEGTSNISFFFDLTGFFAPDANETIFYIETIEIRDDNSYSIIDPAFHPYFTQAYQNSNFEMPDVYLTGNYFDVGEDTDGNGKIDELLIEIEVNVTQAGSYYFDVELEALVNVRDSEKWLNFDLSLDLGIQNVSLHAFVTLPYSFRLDTAFVIRYLAISDTENWEEVFRQPVPLITRVYKYDEFDLPGIYLTGNLWKIDNDIDDDNRIDEIIYKIEVNVTQTAYYSYHYFYYSTDWYIYQNEYLDIQLSKGLRNISIVIGTKPLYTYFNDLTILLEYLALRDSEGNILDMTPEGVFSRVYSYTEFDPPGAYLNKIYSDRGVDIDADGKYEVLELRVSITVLEAGPYLLNLDMHAAPVWNSFREYVIAYWELGTFFVFVNISAWRLPLSSAGNDPIYVELSHIEIWDTEDVLLSYQDYAYTTHSYSAYRFDTTFDTSTEPEAPPGLNGQNVLFGVFFLLVIGTTFLVRQKRYL